jgi:exonuclease SbcC
MRILAIRGENLASLYGPFELPLDRGPIAEAGLFSISGPTGSGKSTLVDALCLALFGKTPRLGERGRGVMVGREGDDPALRVDANDERDLLSRGTAGGFAEVDFEGVDGRAYRARWSVHRARNRPGGKFQPVRVAVTDLGTGDPIGGTVTELYAAVRRLLGYSFEEFRRAVVLPQFEFTAFLKATSADRASILERVTGTDIYSRLSVASFQRSSIEIGKLEELGRRLGDIRVLAGPERVEAEALESSLATEDERFLKQLGDAEGAVRWHETDERNQLEVESAAAGTARARASRGAAEGDRNGLAAADRAEGIRSVHGDTVRTAKALAEARARAAQAEEAVRGAADAQARGAESEEGARSAHADAATRLSEARPEIDRARVLDGSVDDARERVTEATRERVDAAGAADVGKDATAKALREVAGIGARRDAATAWLSAHAVEAPLAAEWPRWQALLRKHAGHVADARRKEGAARAASERLAGANAEKAQAVLRVAGLGAEFGALEKAAGEAESAAAGDDLSALQREHVEADSRRGRLKDLAALARDAARAKADRDEAAREVEEAEKLGRAAALDLGSLAKQVARGDGALEANRTSLQQARDALSLESRRETLKDGAPCPLCGATEHPYSREAPGESLLEKLNEAISRGEKELLAIRKAQTAAEKSASRAEERAKKGSEQRDRHEAALAKGTTEYARLKARADLDGVPDRAPDAGERLGKLAAEAEAALAGARSALDGALERKLQAQAARRHVEERRTDVERERNVLAETEREVERAQSDSAKASDDLRALGLQRDGAEEELDPALSFLGSWRLAARSDAIAFGRSCEKAASEHAGQERALREAEKEAGPAQAALEGARAEESALARSAGDAAAREKNLLDRLAEREAERRVVLGGRPAGAVETELVAAEQALRKAMEEAGAQAGKAQAEVARAGQELTGAAAHREAAAKESFTAEARLAEALVACGLDRARLEALLTLSSDWIQQTRARLQALEGAVLDADSTHAERVRRAAAHAAEGRPAVSKGEAVQWTHEARQGAAEVKLRLVEVQVRLRADAEGRSLAANLSREREAQEGVATRWRALADLIGSSDGKKFRSFAQGLTLDALLRQANHHLLDLAPRYRILRVPGQDLELQVLDRDLGDEVRSVNGLSGGETFLVSLALALALASIATRVTQSRTLFIDEGFGTLDRDTLEHAMVALESLRTSGRTVGVISHVPELHERIGVRVEIERTGVGRSLVVVPT